MPLGSVCAPPWAREGLANPYGCCHNGCMDSGDLSLRPPARPIAPAALPVAPLASPAVPGAHTGENPFGESGRARGNGPVRSLRKRIGSAFAGLLALLAKFGAAI